jgi:hypothetical protein
VAAKKKDKDDRNDEPEKFLGPGASGDVEHPELGAPGTLYAGSAPVPVDVEEPKAKADKK